MGASGGERMDRALEAIESVSLPVHNDLERFVIFVPAGFTRSHNGVRESYSRTWPTKVSRQNP